MYIRRITPHKILTKEKLNTASGSRLKINYKLTNAYVCNQNIYLRTSFILVKDLTRSVILGTSFLNLVKPFQVDDEGLKTNVLEQNIKFEFIDRPHSKDINLLRNLSTTQYTINQISRRQNRLNFLKEDLQYKIIEQQLENFAIIQEIQSLKQKNEESYLFRYPKCFLGQKKTYSRITI